MRTTIVAPEEAPRTGMGTGRKKQPDALSIQIISTLRNLQPGKVTVMEFDDGENMDNMYERVRYHREALGLTDTTKQWRNRTKIMVQRKDR